VPEAINTRVFGGGSGITKSPWGGEVSTACPTLFCKKPVPTPPGTSRTHSSKRGKNLGWEQKEYALTDCLPLPRGIKNDINCPGTKLHSCSALSS
jgi:hypothetical protein